MASLSVSLLGSPQISLDGRPLQFRRRKSRAIVYYLAEHDAPASRDDLAALLWPEQDRPAGQQSLRTALHEVRKHLGEALLTVDDTLALDPEAEVDSRAFEARLTDPSPTLPELTKALQLYRGRFLEGFSLNDSAAWDDWQTSAEERYRRLAVRGFTQLSRLYDEAQNYPAALEALARALDLDPLQEDLQRAALRLHYLSGDRAGAIRRYETLRQLLDEEMGVPPMQATRALYDAIVNEAPLPEETSRRTGTARRAALARPPLPAVEAPAASPSPDTLPFAGRTVEMQALREASAGRRLALLQGAAGIGKTRLAEEHIRRSQNPALRGAARELEQALPYQPIIEALRSQGAPPRAAMLPLAPAWRAEISRLLPELFDEGEARPALPPGQSYPVGSGSVLAADESRLWEAVYQYLTTIAQQRPLILFLDDLHWADASTLGLLGYLVRRNQAAGGGLSFLATARPPGPRSQLSQLLTALTREDRLLLLNLPRLAPDDIAVIAGALAPDRREALAGWLEKVSEGNPYILAELVRQAYEQGIALGEGPAAEAGPQAGAPLDIPGSVYRLIRSRLVRLSDEARRVLDAAVAAGRVFDFAVVGRAAGLSESAALDALDELRAAGLVYPYPSTPRHYRFDHTLTMEVAYREVTEERHLLMHRRVGEAIESLYHDQTGELTGILASHFGEGGPAERAAHYAWLAGQRAARLWAWPEAIAFYEQALEAETDPGRRYEILTELGMARLLRGQSEQASQALREALNLAQERGDNAGAERARMGLIATLLPQGRFAEAVELLNQMCEVTRQEDQALAQFLWGVALQIEGNDLTEAAKHLENAERIVLEQPQPDMGLLAQIKFDLGNLAAMRGDLPRAISHYRETLEVARQAQGAPAVYWQALAYNNLAYHLHLLDPRDPAAAEVAQTGLQLAHEKGALNIIPYFQSTLGEIALANGDLAAAERYFQEGMVSSRQLDLRERIAGLTANLGLVAAQRGETALAVHRLTEALAQAEAMGDRHLTTRIHIWLAPLLPPAQAREQLKAARQIAAQDGRNLLLEEIGKVEEEMSAS